MEASVTDVKRALRAHPAALQGTFNTSRDVGGLWANTDGGVFGTLADQKMVEGLTPMEVAAPAEIQIGPATILSNITG